MDHERPSGSTNGWNEREFDDSSNSNSLDGVYTDEKATSTLKDKPTKSIKNDAELDSNENTSTSRRKRNRALKAVVTEDAIQSDDEKSLNICWNANEPLKIKEESLSPVDDANLSDTGSNNTGDADTQIKVCKTEDAIIVKEEKRTRATNGNSASNIKIVETKAKSKLSSSHCKYCFKKFSNASNLRRHITMSHFGPTKFACNLCAFRARRKTDILAHMRSKHEFGGERTDAFKFYTVTDDTPPKPPPTSVNRRKDKHTEVLRDDEAEIFIDSEAFVVEETGEQSLSVETSNENSNVDMDEDSTNAVTESTDETNKSNSASKRKGRPKAKDKFQKLIRSLSPADQKESESLSTRRPVRNRIMPVKKDFVYDLSTLLKKDYKDFPDEFQKQSLSQPVQPQPQPQSQPQLPSQTQTQTQVQSQPHSQSQTQTQPQTQSQPALQLTQVKSRNASPTSIDTKTSQSTSKRRHTLPDTAVSTENDHQSPQSIDQTKDELRKLPLQQPNQIDEKASSAEDTVTIKGAAEAMAQLAVQANRAAFFKPPELPAERPVATPQRQFDSTKIIDWPILKRPSSMYDGHKSKSSTSKVPGLKRRKRSCLLKHSSNNKTLNLKNCLYDKHKIGTNGHTDNRFKSNDQLDQPIAETIKMSTKLADKMQLQCAQTDSDNTKVIKTELKNSQPVGSEEPPRSSTPPPTNKQSDLASPTTPRRMTLLERLAENKTKKLNESLSRMTIANSDNDSDED